MYGNYSEPACREDCSSQCAAEDFRASKVPYICLWRNKERVCDKKSRRGMALLRSFVFCSTDDPLDGSLFLRVEVRIAYYFDDSILGWYVSLLTSPVCSTTPLSVGDSAFYT